jgi:hypothetical protein
MTSDLHRSFSIIADRADISIYNQQEEMYEDKFLYDRQTTCTTRRAQRRPPYRRTSIISYRLRHYHGRRRDLFEGRLIIEASRSYSDTSHSVGLLWTSDQLVAETSTWQHTTLTRDIHDPGGIRTHNPSNRAAADPRLRPHGPVRYEGLKRQQHGDDFYQRQLFKWQTCLVNMIDTRHTV